MGNELNNNTILVIDDDEIDIMFVERELAKLKLPFLLHVAHDGVEALARLNGTPEKPSLSPQLIILDLMMPKMNGLEFLKALRSDPQFDPIKIFVLTTSSNEKDKKQTQHFNINGYFVKDTQFKDFILQCKKILEQNTLFSN